MGRAINSHTEITPGANVQFKGDALKAVKSPMSWRGKLTVAEIRPPEDAERNIAIFYLDNGKGKQMWARLDELEHA